MRYIINPVIRSNRIVHPRETPKNNRKLQVKLGQIVYYIIRRTTVLPYRVVGIDDEFDSMRRYFPSKIVRCKYHIKYDLQPLIKKNGVWQAKIWHNQQRYYFQRGKEEINQRIWKNGWIGHGVDMNEFYLTWAEANFNKMYY
jgi:hypothetical protein